MSPEAPPAGRDPARDALPRADPASAPATTDSPARVRKFPCPSCGADVVWDPGAAKLKCPYCGAERDIPRTPGAIREHSIEEGLAAPKATGWGTARRVVRCGRCGATQTLDPGAAAGRCAFCGTPGVVEVGANENLARPEGLLPFTVARHDSAEKFRAWLRSLWLRPNDLVRAANLTEIQGVYIPFWTFDAATHSHWTAQAGYRYTVTSGGRSETRIRWESAEGTLEHFFDDLPVPASRGLDPEMVRGVEPFPTANLAPYDPSFLSGFLAEEYAVSLEEANRLARERMGQELERLCAREVPGDVQRNLQVTTAYAGVAYKSALLPLWIAAYDYKGAPFRFLVNGVTGKISGKAPWSWIKVGCLVLVLVTILIFILAHSN